MEFRHEADERFFRELLCGPGEDLSTYVELFDFRPLQLKRREFGRVRNERLRALEQAFGCVCLLRFAPDCDVRSGLTVDYLIPLSSNVLNKRLRRGRTSRTVDGALRKVPSESFGSNNERNLVLACCNCNSFKKHQIPDKETIRRALRELARVAPSNTPLQPTSGARARWGESGRR